MSHPDVLMAFNRPSMEKFESELKAGGLLMYDSTIIDVAPQRTDIEVLPVPVTQMAEELGTHVGEHALAGPGEQIALACGRHE